jgi:hypothetical protein
VHWRDVAAGVAVVAGMALPTAGGAAAASFWRRPIAAAVSAPSAGAVVADGVMKCIAVAGATTTAAAAAATVGGGTAAVASMGDSKRVAVPEGVDTRRRSVARCRRQRQWTLRTAPPDLIAAFLLVATLGTFDADGAGDIATIPAGAGVPPSSTARAMDHTTVPVCADAFVAVHRICSRELRVVLAVVLPCDNSKQVRQGRQCGVCGTADSQTTLPAKPVLNHALTAQGARESALGRRETLTVRPDV